MLNTLRIHDFNSMNLVLTYFVHLVTEFEYKYLYIYSRLSPILQVCRYWLHMLKCIALHPCPLYLKATLSSSQLEH